MASEFDQYARDYKEIIDRGAALTGETFEYFIGLRVQLLAQEIEAAGARSPLRVLDFGCGIGATEKVLRERFPAAAIDGVDPSAESIRAAGALGLRDVTFHVSDSERLPFADSSFDLIYSNGTFHHIDRDKHTAVLQELQRVLKRGGHVFIFENNPLNPLMVRGMRQNPFDAGVKMLFPWYLRKLVHSADLRARKPRFYVFYPRQLKRLRWSERYLRRVPIGAQYYVWGTKP
jgi:ubiquinone/menaquinone biosynthesis C-methylase UbiE